MAWLKLSALKSIVDVHQLKLADFFCELVIQSSGDHKFQLKRSHSYYCQVQGQIAITEHGVILL